MSEKESTCSNYRQKVEQFKQSLTGSLSSPVYRLQLQMIHNPQAAGSEQQSCRLDDLQTRDVVEFPPRLTFWTKTLNCLQNNLSAFFFEALSRFREASEGGHGRTVRHSYISPPAEGREPAVV